MREIPELLERIEDQRVDFLFHGGEPMTYGRENLRELIKFARDNLSNYELRFLMQTNGTLIDEDWIEFFREDQISVGISIDGYPEIHDLNRRDKLGNPTAQKVLDNIRKMRESDFHVGTLMVVTRSLDAEKLYNFIREKFLSLYPDGEVGFCGRDNLARF